MLLILMYQLLTKRKKKDNLGLCDLCVLTLHAEACTAPCTPSAKEQLLTARLGEKKITVPEITCTKDEFNDLILGSFPRLKACCGYELMRCIPNSKHLEIISSRIAQSRKLLKTIVGNGRVFIRPIQTDISLVPDESICSSPEVNPQ